MQHRHPVGIPVANRYEQRHRCDNRCGHRQNDLEQNHHIVRAVNLCGFFDRERQIFYVIFDQNNVERPDKTREDHAPDAVAETELLNDEIAGDHAAAKEHGEDEHIEKEFTAEQRFFCQRVSCCHHNNDAERRTDDRNKQGVAHGAPELRVADNKLICTGIEYSRP